jgi:triacylglycerol esterase/lipase EstA (alpha/beta hydrolase family)
MSHTPTRSKRRRKAFMLIGLALGAGAGLLWLTRDTEPVERARAIAITQFVQGVSSGLSNTLGEIEMPDNTGWLGSRRYDAQADTWHKLSADEALQPHAVLLVHGLDEPGGIWDQLAPALAADGHQVIRFDYLNDQAIMRSADALQRSLVRLRNRGVTELDLVCHSMGGLVVREVLSRPSFDEIGIRTETMITLGTPHKGSPWARLRSVAEMREQVQRWAESDDLDPARLLGFFQDGDGQAGVDLLPGSEFLTQLDSQSLPDGLRVICVVGRTDQPSTLAGTISSVTAKDTLRDLIGRGQAEIVLRQIEQMTSEIGDGVVPVSSAVMDGALDVIVVSANHRGMIRTIELEERLRAEVSLPDAQVPPAIPIVLKRLHRE